MSHAFYQCAPLKNGDLETKWHCETYSANESIVIARLPMQYSLQWIYMKIPIIQR